NSLIINIFHHHNNSRTTLFINQFITNHTTSSFHITRQNRTSFPHHTAERFVTTESSSSRITRPKTSSLLNHHLPASHDRKSHHYQIVIFPHHTAEEIHYCYKLTIPVTFKVNCCQQYPLGNTRKWSLKPLYFVRCLSLTRIVQPNPAVTPQHVAISRTLSSCK
ncbi:hypothetical protein V8G54_030400, partial [Vigna mungo]